MVNLFLFHADLTDVTVEIITEATEEVIDFTVTLPSEEMIDFTTVPSIPHSRSTLTSILASVITITVTALIIIFLVVLIIVYQCRPRREAKSPDSPGEEEHEYEMVEWSQGGVPLGDPASTEDGEGERSNLELRNEAYSVRTLVKQNESYSGSTFVAEKDAFEVSQNETYGNVLVAEKKEGDAFDITQNESHGSVVLIGIIDQNETLHESVYS